MENLPTNRSVIYIILKSYPNVSVVTIEIVNSI